VPRKSRCVSCTQPHTTVRSSWPSNFNVLPVVGKSFVDETFLVWTQNVLVKSCSLSSSFDCMVVSWLHLEESRKSHFFKNPESSSQMKNRFVSKAMASSSSHNTGIPLSTLLEWFKIRDTFFDQNWVSQNIPLALDLAADGQHPDARWLAEACAGKDVTTEGDGKRVFSALGQDDARALCFAWLLGDRRNLTSLRRSAELGFAFAQAFLAGRTRGEECFKFAQLAAAQGERDGFHMLGCCFRDGQGCEKDLDKAKENFFLASELCHVWAMNELGGLLDESDPQRWRWWGRSATLGDSWRLVSNFAKQVELFNAGSGSGGVVFAIGRALQGHVNEEARTIFGLYIADSRIGRAQQAIAFYDAQVKATKDAIRAWTLVGIHFNVVKDVRKLIAKLIWDSTRVLEMLLSFLRLDELCKGM
jgi:TPR repeat protein